MHNVRTTTAKESDVNQVTDLLHGEEREAYGDAGYRGAEKRMPSGTDPPTWHIAMGRKERRAIQQRLAARDSPADRARLAVEKRKASIRAQVEHSFRILKRQFGFVRLRYRGLQKNANHLDALFTLVNIFKHREFLAAAA